MSNVRVDKFNEDTRVLSPLFEDLEKRIDSVRHRAFELFQKRGGKLGHALEDWLEAERDLFGSTATEFIDKGASFELRVALPGFDPKDVQVTAAPDQIIVRAALQWESKAEKGRVLWSELPSRDVFRQFGLPREIQVATTQATLEWGLLRVWAAKKIEPARNPFPEKRSSPVQLLGISGWIEPATSEFYR